MPPTRPTPRRWSCRVEVKLRGRAVARRAHERVLVAGARRREGHAGTRAEPGRVGEARGLERDQPSAGAVGARRRMVLGARAGLPAPVRPLDGAAAAPRRRLAWRPAPDE